MAKEPAYAAVGAAFHRLVCKVDVGEAWMPSTPLKRVVHCNKEVGEASSQGAARATSRSLELMRFAQSSSAPFVYVCSALADQAAEKLLAAQGAVQVVRTSLAGPAWAWPFPGWMPAPPPVLRPFEEAHVAGRFSAAPAPLVPVDLAAQHVVQALCSHEPEVTAALDESEAHRMFSFDDLDRARGLLDFLTTFHLDAARLAKQLTRSLLLAHCPRFAAAGPLRGVLPLLQQRRPCSFRTELRLPADWDRELYLAIAAVSLASSKDGGLVLPDSHKKFGQSRLVTRRSLLQDFLLAFGATQGNFVGWTTSLVVQRTLSWLGIEMLVDTASLLYAMKSPLDAKVWSEHADVLVLCPTHRSILDFMAMGLVGLQLGCHVGTLEIPATAASYTFSKMPILGWYILPRLGAFWVVRPGDVKGMTAADARESLNSVVPKVLASNKPVQVYLEGGRARSRRHLRFKTGFINAFLNAAKRPIMMVPVALSYEKLPDDASYHAEVAGISRAKVGLLALFKWMWDTFWKKPEMRGTLRVRFGIPHSARSKEDLPLVMSGLQSELVELSAISEAHVSALADVLEWPRDRAVSAFRESGIVVHPTRIQPLVFEHENRWPMALQAAQKIGHLLPKAFAEWITEPVNNQSLTGGCSPSAELQLLASRLSARVAQLEAGARALMVAEEACGDAVGKVRAEADILKVLRREATDDAGNLPVHLAGCAAKILAQGANSPGKSLCEVGGSTPRLRLSAAPLTETTVHTA